MIKKLLNRAGNFFHRIANSPAEASRAVFSSLLIVSMVALTLDMGPRIAPQYFGARLLDPLDRATFVTAQEMSKQARETSVRKARTQGCVDARGNNHYGAFLEKFEDSFAGILPGVGNLLLEHPAMVSNRKEKLVFEVMKNYAGLKFCIPPDQFKVVYLADYKNSLGRLNLFFQARLCEKAEGEEDEDEKCNFNQKNNVFIDIVTQEYALVEKDLVSTHKYVEDVIDRAIESAIALDRWTEQRLNNLTAKTNNKLTIGTNELTRIGNDIANENVKVNSANSIILAEINKNTASVQPVPVNLGGAGVPDERGYGSDYSGQTHNSVVHVPSSGGVNTGKTSAATKFSFGVLNLVDAATRDSFLAGKLGEGLALYTAAYNNIDPFVPGSSIDSVALPLGEIALHLCKSVDPAGTDCYSGSVNPAAVAGSVSTTDASGPGEASGINPSPASQAAGTGGVAGSSTQSTPAPYTGTVNVNIVSPLPVPVSGSFSYPTPPTPTPPRL
jgi:hypothetical protein